MPTVEDDTLIRLEVIEELVNAGFDVIEAGNADHAIAVLEARQDMPGSMDGLKLAAAVRDRWPPVDFIITTGKSRPQEIPANALFIPKPYLSSAVVAAMRTFENMGALDPRRLPGRLPQWQRQERTRTLKELRLTCTGSHPRRRAISIFTPSRVRITGSASSLSATNLSNVSTASTAVGATIVIDPNLMKKAIFATPATLDPEN